MKALVRKELYVVWILAIVGFFNISGNWFVRQLVEWDLDDSLYAPAPRSMSIAIFVMSLIAGTVLGYVQVAVERGNNTVSYLVHRDLALPRILGAKTLVAWMFFAVVLVVPVLLYGVWESTFSPLGALVRWERVLELLVLAALAPSAHGLGMLVGTLRQSIAGQVFILVLAACGFAAFSLTLLSLPVGSPALGRSIVVGVHFALAWGFLRLARANFLRGGDPDRVPEPKALIPLAVLGVVFVVLPAHALLSMVEPLTRRGRVTGWPTIARHESGRIARVVRTEAGAFEVDADRRRLSSEPLRDFHLDRVKDTAWTRVWSPDGHEWTDLEPRAHTPRSGGGLATAPYWISIAQANLTDPRRPLVEASVALYWDVEAGVVHAAYLPTAVPHLRTFEHALPESLPVEVELDLDAGVALAESLEGIADFTAWEADAEPHYLAYAARVGRFLRVAESTEGAVGLEAARGLVEVRPVVTGSDRLAPAVEIRDGRTDEVLLVHRYGPRGWWEWGWTGVVTAIAVAKAPVVVLASAFEGDVHDPSFGMMSEPMVRGFARPELLLANLALAAGLAFAVTRTLRRRGASNARVAGWGAVTLLLGPWGGLLFLSFEPLPTVTPETAPRPAAPRLLIQSNGA